MLNYISVLLHKMNDPVSLPSSAMMTAMLDTDIPQSAEAMSLRHHMPSPAGDYTPITTIASSIDDSAAIDLSGLSRNRAVTSDDASRTVDISDVVVSMESVLSSNEADQSSVLTTCEYYLLTFSYVVHLTW